MTDIKPVRSAALQRFDEPGGGDTIPLDDLRRRVGAFEGWRTRVALSQMAGRALREIHGVEIDAKTRLANTATSIAEVQAATAMIARAVPVISGAMERLNAQANAGDQAYSAQEAAAIQSHFNARQQNRVEIESDVSRSGLSVQERDAALSFCDANLADDIARTRARTNRCKLAAEALYERALGGIITVRLPTMSA